MVVPPHAQRRRDQGNTRAPASPVATAEHRDLLKRRLLGADSRPLAPAQCPRMDRDRGARPTRLPNWLRRRTSLARAEQRRNPRPRHGLLTDNKRTLIRRWVTLG